MLELFHGSNVLVSKPEIRKSDKTYSIMNFEKADEKWLDFVIANRTNPTFTLQKKH